MIYHHQKLAPSIPLKFILKKYILFKILYILIYHAAPILVMGGIVLISPSFYKAFIINGDAIIFGFMREHIRYAVIFISIFIVILFVKFVAKRLLRRPCSEGILFIKTVKFPWFFTLEITLLFYFIDFIKDSYLDKDIILSISSSLYDINLKINSTIHLFLILIEFLYFYIMLNYRSNVFHFVPTKTIKETFSEKNLSSQTHTPV